MDRIRVTSLLTPIARFISHRKGIQNQKCPITAHLPQSTQHTSSNATKRHMFIVVKFFPTSDVKLTNISKLADGQRNGLGFATHTMSGGVKTCPM